MRRLLVLLLLLVFGCVSGLEQRVVDLEDQVLMLGAAGVGQATRMYGRDCIDSETDGCAKSMDDIPGTKNVGDLTMVIDSDRIEAIYRYAAVVTEDYPWEIDDDTDGGTKGWVLYRGRKDGNIQFPVGDPENLTVHATRATRSFLVWYNNTGADLVITEIYAISDMDNYAFELFKSASATDIDTGGDTRIESLTCSIDGTGGYYVSDLTIGDCTGCDDTIESGKYLIFEHLSGSAQSIHVYVKGYLD